jgi:hypothetical protein
MNLKTRYLAWFVVALIFGWMAAGRPSFGDTLPPLAANLSNTTVSGLSSGAYMAGQFQVAYSKTVTGAALVAGGPYGCAHTPGSEVNPYWPAVLSWNLARALNKCMEDGWFFSSVPDPNDLLSYAKQLSDQGKIDPISDLKNDKVYLFSSGHDDTVERGVVDAADKFYLAAEVAAARIEYVKQDKAAHAFLTEDKGLACGQKGPPFINDCDYDQAGEILKWLLGPLNPPLMPVEMNYIRFEQQPFLEGIGQANFDTNGIAYIPQSCRTETGCAVHVIFHGCRQGLAAVGDRFVNESGYARWAESNRIVLLFPQVVSSTLNPKGCWDWWGYTGPNFLEKSALQMKAVHAMLDRLASGAQ